MQNTLALRNITILVLAFVTLATIKKFSPEKKPVREIDFASIEFYRPIFEGAASSRTSAVVEELSFQDDLPEESIVEIEEPGREEPESEKAKKVSTRSKPTRINKTSLSAGLDDLSDTEFFEEFIERYRSEVQSKKKYRNDVVVRYYKHAPDGNRADTLVSYGFYLHEKEVRNKSRYDSLGSNVIYYGKDFPIQDVQLIAYLLVDNGISIKRIKRFKDFDGWKRKSIEIGGDPGLKNAKPLTLRQIRDISR